MPSTRQPKEVVEIVLPGVVGTKNIVNVFHYAFASGIMSTADKKQLLDNWMAGIAPAIMAILADSYSSPQQTVRWLSDATDPVQVVGNPLVGLVTGDFLPTDAACYYRLQSGLRGRSNNGSKHFCPIAEDDTVGQRISTVGGNYAAFTTLRGVLAGIITDVSGNVYTPCIVSRKGANFGPANPTSFDVVAVGGAPPIVLNLTLGTMRHRRERTVVAP